MRFLKNERTRDKGNRLGKRLRFEQLEDKRLLAIVWANEFGTGLDAPRFNIEYGPNEVYARALVNRAIADWNEVITDQNFDNDSDPNTNDFMLSIFAEDQGPGGRGATNITQITNGGAGQAGWTVGVPMAATIELDDNGGGNDWFFDQTPLDDIEFTGITNAFQASFVDATTVGQQRISDFYRTITHEIGHALGIGLADSALRIFNNLFFVDENSNGVPDVDTANVGGGGNLAEFRHPGGGRTILTPNGGGHIYEGGASDHPNLPTHPNDLMNAGRTVPVGQPNPIPPIETTRQFISDLDVQLLDDAYGYTTVLPSTRDTAHAMLDIQTGTLLVQGRARNSTTGAGVNDTITLQRVIDAQGDNILVNVNGNLERVPFAQVVDIVIHGNGGTDTITVNPNVTRPWQQVQFVVSSNQDALEIATSVGGASITNGIVDLSAVIPGSQTTLRAAIREANAAGVARGIYVGRGQYNLTLAGSGGDTQGDLDITGVVTIIGAGAGASIISAGGATGIVDRVFDVVPGATLALSRLTVTGGYVTDVGNGGNGGGIRLASAVVASPARLELNQVAIVGNSARTLGGGVYSEGFNATTIVNESVITENHVRNNSAGVTNKTAGAGLYLFGSGTAVLRNSILARNTYEALGDFSDINGSGDFVTPSTAVVTSQGNNRLGDISSYLEARFNVGTDLYNGSPHYIVTGVADTYDRANDTTVRSLREAIDAANTTAGPQEIWLPAWNFILTRERTAPPGAFEMDVAQGDLEIAQSLTIRGVNGSTSVAWRVGVTDKIFELMGDYNNDGITDVDVDTADYVTWRYYSTRPSTTPGYLNADGDDDGDVDEADYDIWRSHFGNSLMLWDVASEVFWVVQRLSGGGGSEIGVGDASHRLATGTAGQASSGTRRC